MEENNKNNVFKDFLPQLKSFVKSETVFGEPYNIGETTIIPVNSVKVGFGFGGGEFSKKSAESSGGGGGVLLTPVAFLVVKGDDVSVTNLNSGNIENIMLKAPEFLEKFISVVQKFQKKKEEG